MFISQSLHPISGSLGETDRVSNNIYLGALIFPEDIRNIPELMFLQLPNNRSELFDHELHLEASLFVRSLLFRARFFSFSVYISFDEKPVSFSSTVSKLAEDSSLELSFCGFVSASEVDIDSSSSLSDFTCISLGYLYIAWLLVYRLVTCISLGFRIAEYGCSV